MLGYVDYVHTPGITLSGVVLENLTSRTQREEEPVCSMCKGTEGSRRGKTEAPVQMPIGNRQILRNMIPGTW